MPRFVTGYHPVLWEGDLCGGGSSVFSFNWSTVGKAFESCTNSARAILERSQRNGPGASEVIFCLCPSQRTTAGSAVLQISDRSGQYIKQFSKSLTLSQYHDAHWALWFIFAVQINSEASVLSYPGNCLSFFFFIIFFQKCLLWKHTIKATKNISIIRIH